MNYQEALKFLIETKSRGSKLGLERMQKLLMHLGNPEQNLKFIHLAGTNGKGSTAMMLSSILSCAGYKTGLYTSPYLTKPNEQFRFNGDVISNEDFAKLMKRMKEVILQMKEDEQPTEFELLTAAAFEYFSKLKCDLVVLETGLGGELDATNIIPLPLVAVITNIGMDHMAYLGDKITQIAKVKAGIIKEHGYVVSYEQLYEVKEVLDRDCKEKNATIAYAEFAQIRPHEEHLSMQKFSYKEHKEISLPLIGEHQRKNAAVALEVIQVLKNQGYQITEEMVKRGLFQVNWPARFEILSKRPLVILDGAHNEQCIDEIKKVLQNFVPNKKVIFIVGVMADKDYKAMIRKLIPIAKEFYTVRPKNERALDAISLAMAIHDENGYATAEMSIGDALMSALEHATPSDVICIIGSLYMAGEARECFMDY